MQRARPASQVLQRLRHSLCFIGRPGGSVDQSNCSAQQPRLACALLCNPKTTIIDVISALEITSQPVLYWPPRRQRRPIKLQCSASQAGLLVRYCVTNRKTTMHDVISVCSVNMHSQFLTQIRALYTVVSEKACLSANATPKIVVI